MLCFYVNSLKAKPPVKAYDCAYLMMDNWDDWFQFSTLYTLVIFDKNGGRHSIGEIKIGQLSMMEDQRRPDIPDKFDKLDDRFFSLGQDDSYYSALNKLGAEMRDKILHALRDVALDLELFERALDEKVMGTSLLRSVDRSTVIGQFHRMAHGGARLTAYEFSYTARQRSNNVNALKLDFSVVPESYPPTNIHVLIGRNGVGKTTLLNDMSRAIVDKDLDLKKVGCFNSEINESAFTSLVSVTFSAFDPFEPLPRSRDKSYGVRYNYIGLKYIGKDSNGKPKPPKTPDILSVDFVDSMLICRQGSKVGRWERALNMLQADPIFRDADVSMLARSEDITESVKKEARRIFKNLSSGHKIVLLTITRLVETVEEKTIVLLDEPEAHLHPPLQSAFIRALSDLLINRNGVAIIATHSPVVLQEVPKSCVWVVRRTGLISLADRPEIQTFGENVGLLTREVFGLEVTQSGFHKMLSDTVVEQSNYESVLRHFDGQLGDEARAIVQGLLATKNNNDLGEF